MLSRAKKDLLVVFLIFSCIGCTHVWPHRTAGKASPPKVQEGVSKTLIRETKDTKLTHLKKDKHKLMIGMIFAKTDFSGVVKTSYVQLAIVDQSDENKSYVLIIGDEARQLNFPWKTQTVNPGYFFIELPVGRYKIRSLTIPVGQTTATEPMDINFEVKANKITYMGTLKVDGMKEKIKLGGVPLIKPGFEYSIEIVDQREEAVLELKKRYPQRKGDVEFRLMEINRPTNRES